LGDSDNILLTLAIALGGDIKEWMMEELERRSNSGNISSDFVKGLSKGDVVDNSIPRILTEEQFRDIINQPAIKRLRGSDVINGELNEADDSKSEMQCNYISVESKLPSSNSTFLIESNINVFKGAEFFYDIDDDIFISYIRKKRVESINDDFDSSTDSSSSEEDTYRSISEPPDNTRRCSKESEGARNSSLKRSSCPPFDEINDDAQR